MMKIAWFAILCSVGFASANARAAQDFLVKFKNASEVHRFSNFAAKLKGDAKVESLGGPWVRVEAKANNKQLRHLSAEALRANPNVEYVQPNYKLRLLTDYRLRDQQLRETVKKYYEDHPAEVTAPADNPTIPVPTAPTGSGADPDFSKQWGMNDIGVQKGWAKARGAKVIVAVIDTGVDYTHPDLLPNLWRNAGEMGKDGQGRDKASNGVDDDGNGFADDTIGWDFVSNDAKPYDLSVDPLQLLMGGGNPGHGTHCAGNVAARADNGAGVAGVAPEAQIMSMRFLSEKGEGTTANAIKAINYSVAMGAKVLSNSWGSEGEDPAEDAENKALRDAIQAAQDKGVLFVAAAGNGHSGTGYDNDSDAKPAYPASYDHDTIVSVAALDVGDKLGSFSNWGARSVDIGAPGVKVYSTTVGGLYSDTVIDLYGIVVTWDGTSMATPHVAGAAALYWSAHPEATYKDVKAALLRTAKPISVLGGKSVSGGKLNVEALMN